MTLDASTRNRLQKTVTACRRLLTADFNLQLQRDYGIYADEGKVFPLEKLVSQDDRTLHTGRLLRERIGHLKASEPEEHDPLKHAVDRVLREQAFTVLNRFAALRMAEERGLIQLSVGKGFQSDAFLVFDNFAGAALGSQYDRYRLFFSCLVDELSLDLGVLFDRHSPFGLLFPSAEALGQLFDALNAPDIQPLWKADETIGWIYQYYNDEAERKKMRESAAPRNSRELAVRNQFFTPRYVVEFLTDNTLGRIWYEMRKGETSLKERCQYLVRRPNEIFLTKEELAPKSPDQGGLTQEELLKQPIHIAHRPLKDPREIRLLDPACGSMHFGLYAFDLFEVVYAEAWNIAKSGEIPAHPDMSFSNFQTLVSDFSSRVEFLRQVPRLIIEHNLHGIDIDPRCAQIAGLSLWLRAQKSWQDMKLRPLERPVVRKSNIVCAEPMPGENELLREFVELQFPAGERTIFAFLLETVFERMTLAGEAGYLLRIEEEIRTAIAEAKRRWKEGPKCEQVLLFPPTGTGPGQGEMLLDLSGITDEQFWERTEQQIYDALKAYAEQAENGGGFQRRLFVDDAAQGFAFIDLCRKRYDVVVMNPPFGLATDQVFEWLRTSSPQTYTELFASFVSRGLDVVVDEGFVGAITSRAFLTTKRLRDWRRKVVIKSLEMLLDLGGQVMDSALVESCAYISRRNQKAELLYAVDARRARSVADSTSDYNLLRSKESSYFVVIRNDLARLPGSKILYSLSKDIYELLKVEHPFEPRIGTVRQGMGTFDDFRFVRLRWEIPTSDFGFGRVWEPLAKGGAFARFYSDIHLALNWGDDGKELGEVNSQHNGQVSQVRQASDYWRKPGCTYSKRSQKGFSARALPSNCIVTGKGPAILSLSDIPKEYLLGWLNSRLIKFLIELQANYAEFNTGILKALPWKDPEPQAIVEFAQSAALCAVRLRDLEATVETNSFFIGFNRITSLAEFAAAINLRLTSTSQFVSAESERWNDHVDRVYGVGTANLEIPEEVDEEDTTIANIDDEQVIHTFSGSECAQLLASYLLGLAMGRWDVRYATGERPAPDLPDPFAPLPACPPGMLQGDDDLPLSPEASRQLRLEGRYPLDMASDGILVDDPEHPLDFEGIVRDALAALGGDNADKLEREACALLGVPTLRAWFRRPASFFADHLSRYSKSRRQAPIYWPLSTASGGYTLWLYYHRLDDQTLFHCVNRFIEPKLAALEKDLSRLRKETDGEKIRQDIETADTLRLELEEMKAELLRVAALPWTPNLNDGVLITASPLWKLFRLPKWQKDLKACWQELERGDYDWAHLAYAMWPDRVKKVCENDRSIAIAHGLEHLCKVEAPKPKKKRGKKSVSEKAEDE